MFEYAGITLDSTKSVKEYLVANDFADIKILAVRHNGDCWVTLDDGIQIAARYGLAVKLRPLVDYAASLSKIDVAESETISVQDDSKKVESSSDEHSEDSNY